MLIKYICFNKTGFPLTCLPFQKLFRIFQLSVEPLPLFLLRLRGKVDLLCGWVILLARQTKGSMSVRRSTTDTSHRRTFSFFAQFWATFKSTLLSSCLSSLLPSTTMVTYRSDYQVSSTLVTVQLFTLCFMTAAVASDTADCLVKIKYDWEETIFKLIIQKYHPRTQGR